MAALRLACDRATLGSSGGLIHSPLPVIPIFNDKPEVIISQYPHDVSIRYSSSITYASIDIESGSCNTRAVSSFSDQEDARRVTHDLAVTMRARLP